MDITDHADDLDELFLADVFEDLLNHTGMELHPIGPTRKRKFAGEVEYLQGQIFEQVYRDARLLDGLGWCPTKRIVSEMGRHKALFPPLFPS